MTLLFAILVFLFALFCAVKAITEQRAKHNAYLKNIDARLKTYAAQTSELNEMLEKDTCPSFREEKGQAHQFYKARYHRAAL